MKVLILCSLTEFSKMIAEHAKQWLGFPVQIFDEERSLKGVSDYSGTIYRLALDYNAKVNFDTLLSRFLSGPSSAQTPAIIIGQFQGDESDRTSDEVIRLLAAAKEQLPNLRGIFLGDIISEENEISWIQQSDITPLLTAYPYLEYLRVRGSNDLNLQKISHANLQSLIIESGGMHPQVVQEVLACSFPQLEHLELWLGSSGYGGDATVEDLQPLLQNNPFPNLRSLGLCDSEIADDIALALQSAKITPQLTRLDLSLGLLSDRGGQALLDNPGLKGCQTLDLHYHYMNEKMMAALEASFQNVNVKDGHGDDPDPEDRYVSVSE